MTIVVEVFKLFKIFFLSSVHQKIVLISCFSTAPPAASCSNLLVMWDQKTYFLKHIIVYKVVRFVQDRSAYLVLLKLK
jgi:hypothetical protein